MHGEAPKNRTSLKLHVVPLKPWLGGVNTRVPLAVWPLLMVGLSLGNARGSQLSTSAVSGCATRVCVKLDIRFRCIYSVVYYSVSLCRLGLTFPSVGCRAIVCVLVRLSSSAQTTTEVTAVRVPAWTARRPRAGGTLSTIAKIPRVPTQTRQARLIDYASLSLVT